MMCLFKNDVCPHAERREGRGVAMVDEGGEKGCHANGGPGHICDVDAAIASVSFTKKSPKPS